MRNGWSRLRDGARPAALSARPRSAGAPSGDAEEEEDGAGARRRGEEELGGAFPAQVGKGRARHLSRDMGREERGGGGLAAPPCSGAGGMAGMPRFPAASARQLPKA